MLTDGPHPLVIAHRGDNSHAPENTLAAFEMAARKGADAIEFDVQLSADGHVVVIHDQTVNRTTNGTGRVAGLTLAELRELDAGISIPGQSPGEKIPTLAEVFESVDPRLYMNIELKNYASPFDRLVENVVELIIKYRVHKRILFSSFFAPNLHKARSLIAEIPRGLLTGRGWLGWWGMSYGYRNECYQALHPNLRNVTQDLVNRVHAAGKRVIVYTINAEQDIKRMLGLGVDGIITDDPALALHTLGRGK